MNMQWHDRPNFLPKNFGFSFYFTYIFYSASTESSSTQGRSKSKHKEVWDLLDLFQISFHLSSCWSCFAPWGPVYPRDFQRLAPHYLKPFSHSLRLVGPAPTSDFQGLAHHFLFYILIINKISQQFSHILIQHVLRKSSL